MDFISNVVSFLSSQGISFGALCTGIYSAWQFFDARKRDSQKREFEVFHRLIKELVQPDEKTGIFCDRQLAI